MRAVVLNSLTGHMGEYIGDYSRVIKGNRSLDYKLLVGGHMGEYIGDYYGGFKGETRSLDYSSCRGFSHNDGTYGA